MCLFQSKWTYYVIFTLPILYIIWDISWKYTLLTYGEDGYRMKIRKNECKKISCIEMEKLRQW